MAGRVGPHELGAVAGEVLVLHLPGVVERVVSGVPDEVAERPVPCRPAISADTRPRTPSKNLQHACIRSSSRSSSSIDICCRSMPEKAKEIPQKSVEPVPSYRSPTSRPPMAASSAPLPAISAPLPAISAPLPAISAPGHSAAGRRATHPPRNRVSCLHVRAQASQAPPRRPSFLSGRPPQPPSGRPRRPPEPHRVAG